MHIINRSFLKLALLPVKLYTRMGVNPAQLKAILTTKLILDDRRPRTLAQTSGKAEKKPTSMATLGIMLLSALMGVAFLFILFLDNDITTRLTLYFTLFFTLLSLTLITDFTTVLIDVRDNLILLPKPVSDKTIVVARLLHIFIHLCKIVVPMSLAGLIFIGIKQGVYGALLFQLLIFLLAAFSIFFINAVYIAILKFTTPQRFQSIITYVQIGFAILVYGGYNFFPQLLYRFIGNNFSIASVPGIVVLPLYWLANSWTILYKFGGTATEISTGIAGLLTPLLCLAVVVNYLAPTFNRKLSLLSGNDGMQTKIPSAKLASPQNILSYLSRLATTGPVEKAGFVFTWQMSGRSRDFKLKVYPAVGYVLVFVVYLFFTNKEISLEQLSEVTPRVKRLLLSALYFSLFLPLTAISQVIYSDKHKASWIFFTGPMAHPGHIITGMTKAVLLKFYFPIAAVVCTVALVFAGISVIPNLLLGMSNVVLVLALLMYAGKQYFPFSNAQSTNAKTGSLLKTIFIFTVAGLLAFGHYIIYSMMPVVIICLALSAIAVWMLFDSLRKISWEKIMEAYRA